MSMHEADITPDILPETEVDPALLEAADKLATQINRGIALRPEAEARLARTFGISPRQAEVEIGIALSYRAALR